MRGGGPHRRLEAAGRLAPDRRADRNLGHGHRRHPRRLPDLPDRHRAGRKSLESRAVGKVDSLFVNHFLLLIRQPM